jgi:hypothetical protein
MILTVPVFRKDHAPPINWSGMPTRRLPRPYYARSFTSPLRPEPTPRLPREPMPVEPEPGVRLAPPSNNTANRRGSAMVEDESVVEIRNRVPLPAGLVDDYRFPQVRAAEREAPLRPAMSEMSTETAVNLRKLEERPTRKPIDEIATLVQGLTYGEMIELAHRPRPHPRTAAACQAACG